MNLPGQNSITLCHEAFLELLQEVIDTMDGTRKRLSVTGYHFDKDAGGNAAHHPDDKIIEIFVTTNAPDGTVIADD